MWVNVLSEPIPTHGNHSKLFKLILEYKDYYGHSTELAEEEVYCMWDSICECFWELQTNKEIDSRDIAYWWKEQ